MEDTAELTPGQLVRAAEVAEWPLAPHATWGQLSPETQQRYERLGARLGIKPHQETTRVSEKAPKHQAETWLHGFQTSLEYRALSGDHQSRLLLSCLEGLRSNVTHPLEVLSRLQMLLTPESK